MPNVTSLLQNYPNPFARQTTIAFELPETQQVRLDVYNLIGRRVATLVNDEILSEGQHQMLFDAQGLPSGLYFYALRTASGTQTQKMLLLK